MSLLSSGLPESTQHPQRHTGASSSKVRQRLGEVSHLQGRWFLAYRRQEGMQESQTVSPVRFCKNVYLQKTSVAKHENENKTDLCILKPGSKPSIIFNGDKDLAVFQRQHV